MRTGPTWRVLVVDDDEGIREALAELLRDAGHQVTTARHGVEGLARLESDAPDVVLVDLMMPVMNGAEFVDEARRRGTQPRARLIAMTASSDTALLPPGIEVLAKPFDTERMFALLAAPA